MPEHQQGGVPMRPGARSGSGRPRESDWIGKKLHQVYGEAMAEPIPENLMAIIRKIGTPDPKSDN
ncbi:MAG: hypothetical protein AB7O56_01820 [Bauldia sp.]